MPSTQSPCTSFTCSVVIVCDGAARGAGCAPAGSLLTSEAIGTAAAAEAIGAIGRCTLEAIDVIGTA